MDKFRTAAPLPKSYGPRLDERVIEYPWVISRLRPDGVVLDAGSTFNTRLILDLPEMKDRWIIVYTLETDYIELAPPLSYMFGDLRNMLFKDGAVDSVVCISTLEHVGFCYDYRTYSMQNPYPDAEPKSYQDALKEFGRVLKPGGQLLLTVPFGRAEDHGWLQQFDRAGVEAIKQAFGGQVAAEEYYRYDASGWQRASAEDCADCHYHNVHAEALADDCAAAARAVVCLELIKP